MPVQILGTTLSGINTIRSGYKHNLALAGDTGYGGALIAWGDNTYGQSTIPDDLQFNVSSIAAGGYHSMALVENIVVAWGAGKTNTGLNNNFGQSIVPNAAKSGVMAIAGGGFHSVVTLVLFGCLRRQGRI